MPHFPCPVDRNKGNRIGTTFSLQTFVTPCHTSGIRLAFGQLVTDHKSENPASGAGFQSASGLFVGAGRLAAPSSGWLCSAVRARSLRELRAPGPSTPDATAAAAAARGGGSYDVAAARRLVRARSESSTARACCRFESCREAHAPRQPRHCPSRYGGGLSRRLRLGWA